jgi:CubicO group peptidase (beta-lactamase class C family)
MSRSRVHALGACDGVVAPRAAEQARLYRGAAAWKRAAGLFLIALLTACATTREQTSVNIDDLMRRYDGDVPGAALLVRVDGRTVLERGYGLADLETRAPVTPHSNFRLASLTKQFTATAILLLAQDGLLSLDDPLRRWLPSLPAELAPVTLRQVLAHRGGLIDYEEVMPADTRVPLRDADVLRLLEAQPRTYFAPGTRWRYSNSGYALLALAVERASGRDFATCLHERVFAPLQMGGSVALEEGRSRVRERAYGYSEVDGQWRRTDQSLTSAVLGDGGIYSSISDLARWDAALGDDTLLRANLRGLAQSAQGDSDDARVHYGFGWRLSEGALWHSGETIGFRNAILRWPAQRLTVVLLSNRNEPRPCATAFAIARRYAPDAAALGGGAWCEHAP